MYEAFYHFHTSPFPAAPIAANYFPSQAIESARQSLIRSIERAEGPGLIVGPAGVGKTLLLRVLAEHFTGVFRVALLSGTRVNTRRALLQNILFELGLPYRGLDEGELRLGLIDALRPDDACPNGILLLVDEAHTLSLRLLDELRMITNVVRDGLPRARLVLAGGPALEERFTSPKLESFNQRIASRCYLQALTREETFEFVRGQILSAGGNPDEIFPEDAIRAVHQATAGIPRLINQICDHALVMARSETIRRLTPKIIEDAWADLQQLPPPWQPPTHDPATAVNTIIEFGELDELDDEEPESIVEFEHADSGECQVDCTDSHQLHGMLEDLAQVHTAVLMGVSNSELPIEWIDGVNLGRQLPQSVRASNPFEDNFEEEVVVLDRDAAWEVEAFRGRTRVSCVEGRELFAELNAATATDSETYQPNTLRFDQQQSGSNEGGAFEFTTVQVADPANSIEAPYDSAPQLFTETNEAADGASEGEFLPISWPQPSSPDDRDLIVVEDDVPQISVVPVDEHTEEPPRRVEYRELFAQLRQAST